MRVLIEIPEEDIPKLQEVIDVNLAFIDKHVSQCTYPYMELGRRTNGDVMRALFPHIEAETYGLITSVKGLDCNKGALDPYRQFWSDWWNAPYRAEGGE